MVKCLVWILAILVFLSGCGSSGAKSAEPEPPVVVMSTPEPEQPAATDPEVPESPETTAPAQPPAAASSEPSAPGAIPTEPVKSDPELTEPTVPYTPLLTPAYQRGDTTPTWRPELAAGYPADALCSGEHLLEKWMAVEGLTMADLDDRDCRQLILTVAQPSDGVETITVCYERSVEGSFVPVEGLDRLRGHIGKKGLMHDRRRDTNTSPAGLWALGFAFGNELPPEDLKLPWRQVTSNSDWVCDENSPYFNTWQERGDPALTPWSDDVEHLEDYPTQYAYAFVIEFNRPPDVVPDRGCAIFLHCGEGGTGGCVSLPRADMLAVLQWLDPAANPFILITGAERGT